MIDLALSQQLSGWFTALAGASTTGQVITAFAGAFAGAWGAQFIAEKTRKKTELIRELRECNAGVALAASLCETMLMLKEQNVAPIARVYESQRARVLALSTVPASQLAGRPTPVIEMDLRSIRVPEVPLEHLRVVAFERLGLPPRPLTLVSALLLSIAELRTSVGLRNEMLEQFRAGTLSAQEKSVLFFGLPTRDGRDERYPGTVTSINVHTENSIFFSWLLCKDLEQHAIKLKSRVFRWPWQRELSAAKVNFGAAEAKGLMPPFENYRSWIENNRSAKPPRARPLKSATRRLWRKQIELLRWFRG